MRLIGVAVYSGETPWLRGCVKEFVEGLAEARGRVGVVLGGYRGGMRLVADECISRGIPVVMVIPREYEDYEYPEEAIVVRTGMDVRGRSVVLVRSSDVLVALGGGAGTLMELVTAYSIGRSVVMVTCSGLPTDKFRDAYPDGVVDPRMGMAIRYVDSCREAAAEALRILGLG